MQRRRIGIVVLIIAVLLLSTKKPEPSKEKIVLPAAPVKRAAQVLRVVSEEMELAADATDFEEHLIGRCEKTFDKHASDFDFPGPNFVSRPLARQAIRPVVKSLIRYATDEKHFNQPEEEY